MGQNIILKSVKKVTFNNNNVRYLNFNNKRVWNQPQVHGTWHIYLKDIRCCHRGRSCTNRMSTSSRYITERDYNRFQKWRSGNIVYFTRTQVYELWQKNRCTCKGCGYDARMLYYRQIG